MKGIQRFVIYIFFFSINFEMWDPFNTGGFFSIAKLIGFVYLLVMAPSILKFHTPRIYKQALWPIILFFATLTFVSIFNIRSDYDSFLELSILQNIVLFWILINHEKLDNKILEKSMISFAIGTVVVSLLFSLGIGIDYDPETYRTSIFGDNANSVGIHMSISLIIIFVVLIQDRLNIGIMRFVLLPGIPLIFYAMISTGSRVSFIAFIMALGAFIVLFKSKNKWVKPTLIFMGFFIAIYTWQFYLKSEGITQRLIMSFQEGDLSNRDIIWKKVWPVWLENPFFGIGKTGYEYFTFTLSGRFISPHNVILEILCLTGITGLFFYSVFLFRVTRISYQFYMEHSYLLSILLLIPVAGLILSAQILHVKIGWIIFSYILANSIYLTKQNAAKLS